MTQLSVAHQDAQAARRQIGQAPRAGLVGHEGEAHRVVRRAPAGTGARQARRHGAVHVGEFVGLHVAAGDTGSQEPAQAVRQFLLHGDADPAAAGIGAHGRSRRRVSGELRRAQGVGKVPHAAAGQEAGEPDGAGPPAQGVPVLHLCQGLELPEGGVQPLAVGHVRQVEHGPPQGPGAFPQLRRAAPAVAPGIGGIVEGGGVDGRPVHEVRPGVVGIAVGVEDVGHAEASGGQHQPVFRVAPRHHVLVGGHRLAGPAQVHGLPQEPPLHPEIGMVAADLVGLPAGESRGSQRIGQAEAVVQLSVQPDLAPRPGPIAHEQGGVVGRVSAAAGIEAVGPADAGVEGWVILGQAGGLDAHRPGRVLRRGDRGGAPGRQKDDRRREDGTPRHCLVDPSARIIREAPQRRQHR